MSVKNTKGVELTETEALGTRDIFFADANCSGQALVESRNVSGLEPWMIVAGAVFPSGLSAPASVYYSNRGTLSTNRAYASVVNNGVCNNEQGTGSFFSVFPNDALVTGVSNTPPAQPLVLGLP